VSIKNIQQEKEVKEEEGAPDYVSAEESTLAEMPGRPNPRIQEIQAQNHLRRLIGGENFRHPQVKDSWRSWYFLLSPDDIKAIWKEAREQSAVSPLFWFIDVCNGKRARTKRKGTEEGSAPPKVRFSDVVFHPEQGEFVADFEALYEDAWRCPDGYFIQSSELRVVRSTDA